MIVKNFIAPGCISRLILKPNEIIVKPYAEPAIVYVKSDKGENFNAVVVLKRKDE